MTQPSLEERWWDFVHLWAVRLHHRVEGVADGVCGVTWSLQRAAYYKWAYLNQDRTQSEPSVGDICSDCGWTLTVKKVYGPGDWWEAKCKQCDLFAISHSLTMAVDKFRKLLLVRSTRLGGPEDERDNDQ